MARTSNWPFKKRLKLNTKKMSCRHCLHLNTPNCQDGWDCFEAIPAINQIELIPIVRDYTRLKRELPEQKEINDLPIFSIEQQTTIQLSLF